MQDTSTLKLEANSGDAPGLNDFFNNPLLSDVILAAHDGTQFHCHKLALSRWSNPLHRMLTGGELAPDRLVCSHSYAMNNAFIIL